MNIAIDGPAGAGKSTIAKILAKKLGFTYLDTGAMYRAVALKADRAGIAVSDEAAVEELLRALSLDVVYGGDGSQRVILDGEDVSDAIRAHRVSKLASDVSALSAVRLAMVDLQRAIAEKTDTVLDGRDIGTFVLPGAEFKFYLTASVDERARRRYLQLKEKGEPCDLESIKRDIAERDKNDAGRALAPLKKADDALEVDTTELSVDGVVNVLYSRVRRAKQ
ncbi:MAG: (d)CMP kinase [Clostridiales bacterium]|jgi:cytidylate kinase|nr:(d)CMP kinase [Clostridiales bacterium]